MSKENLYESIVDFIKEEQIKLGYAKESVRLYYPKSSILSLLNVDDKDLDDEIKTFIKNASNTLGNIEISVKNDRYCIIVPCQGAEYVHSLDKDTFLEDFIHAISLHNCRKSDLEQVFKKYSKDYVVEDVQIEDFDYCMYFIDETVNKYIYCIKDEGVHLTYHRFTREDYKELNYFSV